jgi:putative FmdB family regulatory protein
MPTYQYRCAKCGEQFELWQSIHDDALQRHPGCGGAVTKVMAPAGIVLKGSGFYRTDSRSAGRKSRDKEPAKDGAGSNGSDAEKSSKDSTSEKSKDPKPKSGTDAKPSKNGGSKSSSSSS